MQRYGNQEGSHADDKVGPELARVIASARFYRIGGKPPDLGPQHVVAVAQYVASRAMTLLSEDAAP